MQLISVAVYNRDGRVRPVNFRTGRLNIVTGSSRTGKSALLEIVDYCLGRDEPQIPLTKAFRVIGWYGCLWEFKDGSRAFTGRPMVKPGKSTSRAMLLLGGPSLTLPQYDDLVENVDSATMRDLLGAQVGLEESRMSPPEGSVRTPYKVGIGQAAIFSFQTQSEIANKSLLFHRQGDEGMTASIRESLPFFLGAVSGDHAKQHEELRRARRDLRRAEIALESARAETDDHDAQLQALVAEAHAADLTDVDRAPNAELALSILTGVLARGRDETPVHAEVDTRTQDRAASLRHERQGLTAELGYLLDKRDALLSVSETEGGYDAAISKQAQRLRSIGLVPAPADSSSGHCPVCAQKLLDDDPTATQLSGRLSQLSRELEALALAHPGRQKAMAALGSQIHGLRERLVTVETAIAAQESVTADVGALAGDDRAQFVRGRIDATIGRLARRQVVDLSKLTAVEAAARRRVEALERDLDDDLARERLTSALIRLGRDMTDLARELEVENAEIGVRLDATKLTVVTDTADGPIPLSGLGSGANWLGYHLATHLALHKMFVETDRPLPRLLMLDQPTQAFYESRSAESLARLSESGKPEQDDHVAVTRMFDLLDKFTKSLAPDFQIIVSDHAHLEEDWFEDAVEHNWRGDALIPSDWIEGALGEAKRPESTGTGR